MLAGSNTRGGTDEGNRAGCSKRQAKQCSGCGRLYARAPLLSANHLFHASSTSGCQTRRSARPVTSCRPSRALAGHHTTLIVLERRLRWRAQRPFGAETTCRASEY